LLIGFNVKTNRKTEYTLSFVVDQYIIIGKKQSPRTRLKMKMKKNALPVRTGQGAGVEHGKA
jgi:hypothetical protein